VATKVKDNAVNTVDAYKLFLHTVIRMHEQFLLLCFNDQNIIL